jgi:mycoredoxin
MSSEQTITVYGLETCADCKRTRAHLDALDVPFEFIDIELDAQQAARARAISGRASVPVVVYPDSTHHVEPTNAEVSAKLRTLSIC